ncbi:MAG: hypothetical protein HN867_02750, partial [Deltaproteobacteria bacterium]|nr:hypothetical protein [Deltaproteobacteria bacterium]
QKLSWPNSVHRLASYNAYSHKEDHVRYRSYRQPWFQTLPTEGNWLLKGLKQTTILRWDVGSLQQLWSLPQWERQTEELWREDLLDQVL